MSASRRPCRAATGSLALRLSVGRWRSENELEPIVVGERRRGRGIGRRLAEHVVGEARAAGARYVVTRPVARNAQAIRFFHGLGFDAVGQLELLLDLRPPAEQVWRPGATIAGSELRV